MNELYVTGVVIPNGIPDHENDVLNKQDIKKIFTKYINRDTDTMHTRIRNEGVDVLANWISEADTIIAGKVAPAGSWLATFKITNEEIIQSILDGNITGLSLGSVSDIALTQKFWFINKSINYRDLDDAEEVIPLFISFVDKPSNMYGLEVMDYNVYINKNAKEVENMSEQNKTENVGDETLSVSAWERIMDKFGINKRVTETEPVKTETENTVETEQVEVNKTETADISNAELLQKIPEAVATGITSAFEKMGAPKTEEVTVNKNETPEETEEVEETETEPVEEQSEETEETNETDVEINKRQTVKNENVETPEVSSNFYKKSGRNEFGCRIKK